MNITSNEGEYVISREKEFVQVKCKFEKGTK